MIGLRCLTLFSVVLACAVAAQTAKSRKPAPNPLKPAPVRFVDIAAEAGLDALNVYGNDTHKEFIIETTCNGAVIFDYDNDGWPDVFLPNGSTIAGFAKDSAPTGHLYRNNHDGSFTDVTKAAGLARTGWAFL